jgi:predicted transcriptional regulator YdeE
MNQKIKKIIILLITFTASANLAAAEKEYLRDYTYQASETDSKVSARETALLLVKQNLLSEIGTYVDSNINLFSSSNGVSVSSQQIQAITEGFIKTEIAEEKWNGVTFYIKAKLTADPDRIADRLRSIYQSKNQNKAAGNEEFEYWKSVVKIDAMDSYLSYMSKYPQGKYQELAQIAIARLQKQKANEEKNNRWLVHNNGVITVVARHDVGRASDLDNDVITAEVVKSAEKIIKQNSPDNITFNVISDFNETDKFRFAQQEQSQEVCKSKKTDLVAGVMLEDHTGTQGMLRPVKIFMYNCKNDVFKLSSFVPKEKSKKDFWRDAAIRKNLRAFIQDYLDIM